MDIRRAFEELVEWAFTGADETTNIRTANKEVTKLAYTVADALGFTDWKPKEWHGSLKREDP
jgi:hypothetical protein